MLLSIMNALPEIPSSLSCNVSMMPRNQSPYRSYKPREDSSVSPQELLEQWNPTPPLLNGEFLVSSSLSEHRRGHFTQSVEGINIQSQNQYDNSSIVQQGFRRSLVNAHSVHISEDTMQYGSVQDISRFYSHQIEPLQYSLPHQFQQMMPALKSMDDFLSENDPPMEDSFATMEMQEGYVSDERSIHQYLKLSTKLPAPNRSRFNITLNAPTAMNNRDDGIPLTYLNKGRAYSISIVDTMPHRGISNRQYRTAIRMSFKDDYQREIAAKCWQTWKEGRGARDALERGGDLHAVEYLEASYSPMNDTQGRTVELSMASVDGFSVLWTAGANDRADCDLVIRFNFLSTDFSHTKGVKGAVCRLCTKTEVISDGSGQGPTDRPEISFCEVKLFREHGAERKLQNDFIYARKVMDKVARQIAMVEVEPSQFSITKAAISSRRASVPSARLNTAREDPYAKFQKMQEIFSSSQPSTVFYLRGQDCDDPDVNPVVLNGDSLTSTATISPFHSRIKESGSQTPPGNLLQRSPPQRMVMSPDRPTKVPSLQQKTAGPNTDWIEVLDVDTSYTAPIAPPAKPVACFYALYRGPASRTEKYYYRALYLMKGGVQDLITTIATKYGVDPSSIIRATHIDAHGRHRKIDDAALCSFPQGQEMILEFASRKIQSMQWEWGEYFDNSLGSGQLGLEQGGIGSEGFEILLFF